MNHTQEDRGTEPSGRPRKTLLWVVGIILAGLLVAYAVTTQRAPEETATETQETILTQTYTNDAYGFSFNYPEEFQVRDRAEDQHPYEYLGLDVQFFASVRDMEREEKPVSIVFLYAAPGLTVDDFTQAINASDMFEDVTSTEQVTFNGVEATKVVNGTQVGGDKTHYLVSVDDTMIIFSIFLDEEELFEPMLQTLSVGE